MLLIFQSKYGIIIYKGKKIKKQGGLNKVAQEIIKLPGREVKFESLDNIEYGVSLLDSEEISNVNIKMIELTILLKDINKNLIKYERNKMNVDLEYKHKYRELFVSQEAKNENHRRILAEIGCQELEMKQYFLEEVIKELTRQAQTVRFELEVLKNLSFNLRKEMDL